MARKSIQRDRGFAGVQPVALLFESAVDEWIEFQTETLAAGLGQAFELQQALWSDWAGIASAWWRLPDARTLANPWLPFWVRGGEQLA